VPLLHGLTIRASVTVEGNLLIEGSDFGDGVERALGVREYEWVWTIPVISIPALLRALGIADDLLSALEERFSGDQC
jgi:hypothetical protein